LQFSGAQTYKLASNLTSGNAVTGNITIDSGATLDTVSGSNFGIAIAGNWANAGTFTANSGTVTFTKTSSTQTLNGGSSSFYNVTHSGAGTLQLSTSSLTATNNFTNSAGTFDANNLNLTIGNNYDNTGGTFTAGTGTVTFNAGDSGNTLTGTMTGSSAFYDITFNNALGAWSFAANSATVTHDFTVTAGAVTAPSSTLTIGRNFVNTPGTTASFVHNSGTVVFNTSANVSTIIGATTFYNFTVTTSDKVLNFTTTQTFTINGLLTLTGTSGHTVVLTSTATNSPPSSNWIINHQGTESVTYTTVSYASCNVASTTISMPTGNVDGGNNGTCWSFVITRTISGILYNAGGGADTTSRTLTWSKDGSGVAAQITTTGGTGAWTFNADNPVNGDVFTIWVDNEAVFGSAVIKYGASCAGTPNCTGISIREPFVSLFDYHTTPLTNSEIGQCDTDTGTGCSGDADIKFTVTGSNFVLGSGVNLILADAATYTPGGTVTTPSSSAGDSTFYVPCSTTVNMGTNALSIGGGFGGCGTVNVTAGQTTTFTSTGVGNVITIQNGQLQNVVLNGSGGGWSFSENTILGGDLTVTAGTLSGTADLTVNGGDVTGAGTINLTGGTLTVDSVGSFGSASNWTTNNLTLTGSGNATTGTGAGTVTVSGVLTIGASHTLDASTKTWILSGTSTPFVKTGSLTVSTSTFKFTGNGATGIAATSYYNLELKPSSSSAQVLASGTYTVGNNLVVGDGTHAGATGASNNPAVSVAGTMTIAAGATYITGTGTLTLSGSGTPISRSGTFTATSGNTTQFTSTTGIAAISSAAMTSGNAFYNLTIDGDGGGDTFTAGVDITVTNDFTISTGDIFASANNVTVYGVVSGAGVINHTGGTFTHSTTSSKNFGSSGNWTFNNLTLTGSSGTSAATGAGSVDVLGVLTVNSGHTLSAGAKTWTLDGSGTPFVLTGSLTPGTSTFDYTGTSATDVTVANYYNLELEPGFDFATYTLLNGNFVIDGNLTLGDGVHAATIDGSNDSPNLDIAGDVTINSSTNFIATGGTFTVGGSWTDGGGFDNNGYGVVFDGSGSKTITTGGDPFNDLTFNNAGGTWTLQDDMTVSNVLTITAGNLSASNKTITLTGAGTPFVNSGTFTQGTSTVNYIGVAATNILALNGASTTNAYYNLGLGTTGNAISVTYTLAGSTTVDNIVTVSSAASSSGTDTLALGSSTLTLKGTGTPLNIAASGKGAFSGASGTVIYSGAGTTALSSIDMTGSNKFGNINLTGTGTFNIGNGIDLEVALEFDGAVGAVLTGASGGNSSDVTVHSWTLLNNVNMAGGTFTHGGGSYFGCTTCTFYNLTFGEGSAGGAYAVSDVNMTVTNVFTIAASFDFNVAYSGTITLTGTGTPFVRNGTLTPGTGTVNYTGAGATNITAANYYNLGIKPGTNSATHTLGTGTFTVDGTLTVGNGSNTGVTVTAATNNPIIDINGTGTSFDLKANTTFVAPAASFTVAGSWGNAGTFTHNSGTVTFDATSSGKTITSGGSSFNNVILNGSGGGWSPSDAMVLAGDLTVTNGTLSGTNNVTVNGGDVTGNGTINMTGGTFLVDGTGSFGGSTAWAFTNLNFGDGTGTTTTTQAGFGNITTSSVMTVAANQTLNASSASNIYILSGTGTPLVMNGTFSSGFTELRYTSGTGVTALANTSLTGTNSLYSFKIQGAGTFNLGTGISLTVKNTIDVVTGALSAGSNAVILGNTSVSSSGRLRVASGQSFTQATDGSITFVSSSGGTACVGGSGISCTNAPGTITLGDVTIGDGSTAFTFNFNGTTPTFTADTIAITAGPTVNGGTASIINLTGNSTVLTNSGTFNAQTSTINFNSAGTNGTTIPVLTYYNLGINKASNTFTAAGDITVSNNLAITNGTFVAPSGTLTIVNDFTNSGTFNANAGTVLFTPATGDTIDIGGSSNTTFNNFTNTTADTIIQFASGKTYAIDGVWTVRGSAGLPVAVRSSTPGVQWFIDINGSTTLSYLFVQDSGCSSSNDITPGNKVFNQGNNGTCWKFIVRSGGSSSVGDNVPGSNGSGGGGGGQGGQGGSAQAVAVVTLQGGSINSVDVTSGGSGYVVIPLVCFAGGSPSVAGAGTAVISSGAVTSITITISGSGYQSTPTVVIGAPGSSGGTCSSGGGGGGTGGGGGGSP
jgi:fibronectin-binding autotransporter adhesin